MVLSCSEWVDETIRSEQIFQNKDCTGVLIRLLLPVGHVSYYRALQVQISSLIPNEWQRPTIWLDVLGDLATTETPLSAAIIGGMGPVSDSSLLVLTMEKLDPVSEEYRCCRIQILSAPPPRTFSQTIFYGWSYLSKVRAFLGQCYGCPVFLASNTAHVYHSTFNYLSDYQTVNMCENVSDKVANICSLRDEKYGDCGRPNGVLVLGTSLARTNQLYDTLLNARNVPFCYVPIHHQDIIQQTIDDIKSGRGANISGSRKSALEIIETVVQKHNNDCDKNDAIGEVTSLHISVILLGCTELPLAFISKSRGNEASCSSEACVEGARRLRNLAAAHGIEVVDTEDVFAETIAEYIRFRLNQIKEK